MTGVQTCALPIFTSDGLRFDFTHYSALTPEEISRIEHIVNDNILLFIDVDTEIMSKDAAVNKGATALFDEKYGDDVRVVSMGNASVELCGGTHVANTGQIGMFKIVSEYGVAAGVRRIEGITGLGILNLQLKGEALIHELSDVLKSKPDMIVQKAGSLRDENRELKKENSEFRMNSMKNLSEDLINSSYVKGDIKLVSRIFDDLEQDSMMKLVDEIKAKTERVVIVFANRVQDKASFAVSVSDDLLETGLHAGNLVKEISAVTGGKGGGKADTAREIGRAHV